MPRHGCYNLCKVCSLGGLQQQRTVEMQQVITLFISPPSQHAARAARTRTHFLNAALRGEARAEQSCLHALLLHPFEDSLQQPDPASLLRPLSKRLRKISESPAPRAQSERSRKPAIQNDTKAPHLTSHAVPAQSKSLYGPHGLPRRRCRRQRPTERRISESAKPPWSMRVWT